MTINIDMAKWLEQNIGHYPVHETHVSFDSEGSIHLESSVALYMRKGSSSTEFIRYAKIKDNVLNLERYDGLIYPIKIEG